MLNEKNVPTERKRIRYESTWEANKKKCLRNEVSKCYNLNNLEVIYVIKYKLFIVNL